jgi:putative ABC transport system permease protein
MFDLDHWREIGTALAANKLRTGLTAFGVFWGILMLMIMLGSGTGLENGVTRGFSDNATNSVWIWSQSTSKPYRGLPIGRNPQLMDEDTAAIRERVAGIGIVAPRLQLGGWRGGNNVTRGDESGAFSVNGDVPEIMRIEPVRLTSGRFLNRPDVEERRKVAVIGPRVVEVLFEPGENPIGEHIRINGVYFKVVGTFKPISSDDQQDQETIHVPLTTFQHAFNAPGRVHWFALIPQDGVPSSRIEDATLALLRQRHKVHPDDQRAFGHFNLEKEYKEVQGLFVGIRTLVWIVGLGTLAAGVIGVSNIMLVIVRERTHEIGIRRAIGATPAAVMGQIVLEAVLLTSAAGYAGLVLGMVGIDLIASALPKSEPTQETMFLNPAVDLTSAMQALAILIVAGCLAGIIPARRAVATTPVNALRSEA